MKTNRSILSTIKVLAVIAAMILQSQCGEKEIVRKAIKANIIFLIGSVEVLREGSKVANINPGDIIREGDKIKTGDKSQMTIQMGDRGFLRIVQNTEVEILKLFSKEETNIFLQDGEIISKVARLVKDENYVITTGTIKAAVRGTAFSVSTIKDGGEVAVLEGKVMVTVNENISGEPAKETYVKDGEMVIVQTTDAKSDQKKFNIQIMPITQDKSIAIQKTAIIKLIPDIENVKIEELNIKQQEMLKKEEELDKARGTEKVETGTTSKIKAATIEQLIKQKTRTLNEIKKVNGRIDEISLNSGQVVKGAIISKGDVYSVLTTTGVINVPKKDIRTISVVK